ncbi:Na+/solute symporter [Cellulophaga lytica DSM 7489]|uniref:Na+/solute symporter n=1 Tax=Cellulophaga lytica (strain ATCC 23178 / DSM 7489 / JCM 8516 / NBRC 14961 / NCIMB 1423 / VKM B-1433 / Cy l20) TaxID=867900 RepID=F0RBW6_CELLC|nr:sodium:solute symporter [Cellulophaga lytica]ADY28582.1 Na+/solute symporter [Cellulophaga lytica DSM 7489]WQG77240.1 sodium:solute symporter [Cellulophaga lytica]
MTPIIVFSVITGYFGLLMLISYLTSRKSDNDTFFTGNRKSPWYLVAYGMVGASLSGVTFISVPGEVANTGWTYLQFVLGNIVGYVIIAFVLIPLFYKLNLISIYEYLKDRFGLKSYRTGASFFLISQTIGASFRLFLAAIVLQIAFFDSFGIPFWVTVLVTISLIWLYTFRGGIKTIVWTDTIQTTFLLLAVTISIIVILSQLNLSFDDAIKLVTTSPKSKLFEWDWLSDRNFFKTFTAGIFITIAMNGLDQNVMQKNLTCKNVKDAQKNILWFSITFLISTLLFLILGVLLYQYALANNIPIPERTDDLYPLLALNYFGLLVGIVFLLGIIAAAFSSADSALTALTTSFCIDILNIRKTKTVQKKTRLYVHIGFTMLMFLVIIVFNSFNDASVVSAVFKVAGFTYGPILGLYSFGLITRKKVKDKLVPLICIIAPILSIILNYNSEKWFNGFKFGFEILIVNAILTMLGLWLITIKPKTSLN